MDTNKTIVNLDGQQLALWAYLRSYGQDKVIHIHDIHRDFPFAKYLFPTDSDDMRMLFEALVRKGLLRTDEIPQTYRRVAEDKPLKIWPIILNRLINTSHGYVRDRTYDLPTKIPLHEFAKLDESLRNKHLKDPFLSSFSTDTRLARSGWWKRVYDLAHLYDQVTPERISSLLLKFAEVTGLELSDAGDTKAFTSRVDAIWSKDEILELEAVVYNVTPYKAEMKIQIIVAQWRDISLARRDQIQGRALKSLLNNATIANMILPVGNPSASDEETLRSTQLAIFTPDDFKDISIGKNPNARFKEMLRYRMNIELLSPYQITGSVPKVMFFGRDEQLRLIAAHFETNYAIYGSRQSGKTSLMKQLQRIYEEKGPVAFINCELVFCEEDFLSLLCKSLKIEANKSAADIGDVFRGIQPNTLLLIDEVDHVLDCCDPDRILSILRHLNGQYNTRCIFAGITELYKQYRNIRSPMYNFANPLPLGSFAEVEAIALAKNPMLGLDVVYEDGDSTIKQLVNLCGRFPNLIQLMCHDLIKEVKSQGTGRSITSKMIKKVFQSNAFGGQVYKQFHANFNPYQKLIVYSSLMVKSMSLRAITERVQEHYSLSISRIEELLDELVTLFVFEKSGDSYTWLYSGFPTILKNQIRNETFMITQIIQEIKGETKAD